MIHHVEEQHCILREKLMQWSYKRRGGSHSACHFETPGLDSES